MTPKTPQNPDHLTFAQLLYFILIGTGRRTA